MRYEKRDITTIRTGTIAHGVNCQGVMGSGVARALYDKWPEVKEDYLKCKDNRALGVVQTVQVEPSLYVVNCFTQEHYGRDGRRYASPEAISEALDRVCNFVRKSPFLPEEIYLPRIGCGLGGLDWERDVEPILQELEAKHMYIQFVVCDVD